MQVSAANDLSNSMIQNATRMKSGSVQNEIGAALVKSIMNQQKQQTDALIKMINANNGVGTRLDVSA